MLEELEIKYRKLQKKYGNPNLDSITFGGCKENPDVCFVFMNPTARNVTSSKDWKGIKSPWVGTKNVWTLFNKLGVIDDEIYSRIRSIKGSEWTYEFAEEVYEQVSKNKFYITNLAKCTQVDARALPDSVYKDYLDLFIKEMEIIKPKVIILFGNQVSSVVLGEKISVSQVRKKEFLLKNKFKCYSVFYPVGNGSFNVDKSIEDILYIIDSQKK
jgi:DNA polymerase